MRWLLDADAAPAASSRRAADPTVGVDDAVDAGDGWAKAPAAQRVDVDLTASHWNGARRGRGRGNVMIFLADGSEARVLAGLGADRAWRAVIAGFQPGGTGDLVVAVEAQPGPRPRGVAELEPGDEQPAGLEMRAQAREHAGFGAVGEKDHHVAGGHDRVEAPSECEASRSASTHSSSGALAPAVASIDASTSTPTVG